MPRPIGRWDDRGHIHPCAHVAGIRTVVPHTPGCPECVAHGDGWIGLRLCLYCGWVACCDDSPHHHAKDHYEETDHPITAALPYRPGTRWCYVHQRLV